MDDVKKDEVNPVELVETFIRKLHDLDYVFTPDASKAIFEEPTTEVKSVITDELSNAMSGYMENENDPSDRSFWARICVTWINRAFLHEIIGEGEGVSRKLVKCQEENIRLQSEISKLKQDIDNLKSQKDHLQGRYDELDSRLMRILPSESSVVEE